MKQHLKKASLGLVLLSQMNVIAPNYIGNISNQESEQTINNLNLPKTDKVKIQVALLLDTSNSMDGLIDQAKSRLWHIINTLTTLKFNDEDLEVEIGLYEYGNASLPEKNGYIRKVTAFTTDLDLISEHLFALKTNGGLEYCGQVISDAVNQLE